MTDVDSLYSKQKDMSYLYRKGGATYEAEKRKLEEKGKEVLSLKQLVGGGYNEFWNFKGRYRVCKGSRGSKKSKTTALWVIAKMMSYPEANTLVIRKYFSTLRDSFFKELKWAIKTLRVEQYWKVKETPLEMTYKPTGQKILFRGLDNGIKVTSITVETGCLCWTVFEEAYEIENPADFDIIDESIRGALPEGLWAMHTLIFNPWHECWLKTRFFDHEEDPDILAITTTYMNNEFLSPADIKLFERMKMENPRRYNTAGLGNWGVEEGLVYDRYDCRNYDYRELLQNKNNRLIIGLDFGFANDPTALICAVVDKYKGDLWVFAEMYQKGLTNKMIADKIKQNNLQDERIICDSAEPKSIAELKNYGIYGAKACRKGKDSILYGIQTVQNYSIHIHPNCKNFLKEINSYCWGKDKDGTLTGKPVDKNNHLMDALRYALTDASKPPSFSFE